MDDRWGFMRLMCAPLHRRLSFCTRSSARVPMVTYAGLNVRLPTAKEHLGPAVPQPL